MHCGVLIRTINARHIDGSDSDQVQISNQVIVICFPSQYFIDIRCKPLACGLTRIITDSDDIAIIVLHVVAMTDAAKPITPCFMCFHVVIQLNIGIIKQRALIDVRDKSVAGELVILNYKINY